MGVQTSSNQSGTTCSYNFESIAAMQSAFRKEVTSAINTLNIQNTQLSEAIRQMSQKLAALSEQDGTVKSSWTDEDGTLHEELYDHSAEMADLTDQIADAQAALDANLTQIGELNATLEDTETFINNLCQQVMETDADFANKIKELQKQVDTFVSEMSSKLDTIKQSINTNYANYVKVVTDYYASDSLNKIMNSSPSKELVQLILSPNIGKVKTALEGMGLNIKTSGIKQTFQERFYQDYYEDLYAPDKLDNLFFITDMRLKGLDSIFLDKQINNSANLYTLASSYPDYYKLDSHYGLTSTLYNNELENFLLMINLGSLSKEENDKLIHGIIEQSIYEIRSNPDIKRNSSYATWSTFSKKINKISQMSDTVSKIMNYQRNEFNMAPSTWAELVAEKEGWDIQVLLGSGYHMQGKDGLYNIKLTNSNGSEAVYDKNGNLITDPKNQNIGTYNYGGQEWPSHTNLDMNPYEKWGLFEGDTNTIDAASAFFTSTGVWFDDDAKMHRQQMLNQYYSGKE